MLLKRNRLFAEFYWVKRDILSKNTEGVSKCDLDEIVVGKENLW